MKKALLITLLSIFSIQFSYSQNLQAFMSYSLFSSPVDGPYIETYLSVFGQSIQYVQNENGKFEATVSQPWENDSYAEDLGCLFVDVDGDNDMDLYVASGGNEFSSSSSAER